MRTITDRLYGGDKEHRMRQEILLGIGSVRDLMEKYFSGWARECGVSMDDLMALGHRVGDNKDDPFNMAVMGLRLAGRSNAVAKLHGEVSREMFSDLWPDVPDDEVPIGSVTNGVHSGTWVAPEISDLLAK